MSSLATDNSDEVIVERVRELLVTAAVDEHEVRGVARATILGWLEQEFGSGWTNQHRSQADQAFEWARRRGDIAIQRGGKVVPLPTRALAIPRTDGGRDVRIIGADAAWRIGADPRFQRIAVQSVDGVVIGHEYLVADTSLDAAEIVSELGIRMLHVEELLPTLGNIANLSEWTAVAPNEPIHPDAWNGTMLKCFVPRVGEHWAAADALPHRITLLKREVDEWAQRVEYRLFVPPNNLKPIDAGQAGLWRFALMDEALERGDVAALERPKIHVHRSARTVRVPWIPMAYVRWLRAFGWQPERDGLHHLPLGDLDQVARPFVENLRMELVDVH